MRTLYALALISGFGLVFANGFFGMEIFGAHKRVVLPPDVRQTPGAYRTFLHNNGFHGGK